MFQVQHLTDQQLREQLFAAYATLQNPSDEPDVVKALKAELYRRGYAWRDIVEIAIASLMSKRFSLN